MKKVIFTLAALFALQSGLALAANGGTVTFSGSIVKEPCAESSSDLLKYAMNPHQYQAARKVASGHACAGMDNTQSLSLTSVNMANAATQRSGQLVTVIYN
jgi:type 1 fimbria pilin